MKLFSVTVTTVCVVVLFLPARLLKARLPAICSVAVSYLSSTIPLRLIISKSTGPIGAKFSGFVELRFR